jgi:hypothetical protein
MESPTAGQQLAGRFRLIRRVGRGGMGEAWLAEEPGADRLVVVKFPGHAAWAQAEFVQARRLAHPGIVRLFEFNADPPFLVMQYVDGGDVGTLRGAGFVQIVAALIPVAEAIEYAHRQGVVHRDLKPANVLRDREGRCLVSDFGIGAQQGGGSLPYMSPQQLDGEPPAPGDDVYGFGALLYELIAGQPPFHPQATAERVRAETPVVPLTDLTGTPLPDALRRLLSSLLQKSASQRPAGMGAVRASLEEVLRECERTPRSSGADLIVPQPRAAAVGGSGTTQPVPPRVARRGLPAPVVYGAAGLLLVAALVVIFYLPTVVRERGPLVQSPSVASVPSPESAPAAGPSAPSAAAAQVPRAALDEAMGRFMQDDDELRKLNADKWGGADWDELRRLAQSADTAYRRRDLPRALADYQGAADAAGKLLARAPSVLADALRAGSAALAAGDQSQAIRQFETALAIEPDNAQAAAGRARAGKLDKVLALVNAAGAAESAGQRAEALRLYRDAAALDPAWPAAAQGVARLTQAAARDAYETQMARALAAQAAGDAGAARAAYEAALRARPGDASARDALAQIAADENARRLAALQAEALSLESQERWAEAVSRYESLLSAAASLQGARAALERARTRAALDERLRRESANADRYNDDAVLRKAQALLEEARAVPYPGPVLQRQVAELAESLRLAMTPVAISIESDNLTEVTVFKVGRLGVFSSRTLELRPGVYTAVGSRPGYRDVRRNFRVGSGSDTGPVVVRCEEPI